MSFPKQSAIIWPEDYLPGTTDNFVSNERIEKGITASQIWKLLNNITRWQTYYHNCDQVQAPASGPHLQEGDVFHFSTFGFPVLESTVRESKAPTPGSPGRLAWSAALAGDADTAVSVYHAWLVEDLDGGRVRVLTQESQRGKPAAHLAGSLPNRMLLGHQDWLDGLIAAARGTPSGWATNLSSVGLDAYARAPGK